MPLHAQGIRDITQAERILANGLVDMVGMTRAHIADPHIMKKVREGREDHGRTGCTPQRDIQRAVRKTSASDDRQ